MLIKIESSDKITLFPLKPVTYSDSGALANKVQSNLVVLSVAKLQFHARNNLSKLDHLPETTLWSDSYFHKIEIKCTELF